MESPPFNPTFKNLEAAENAEIRFTCEALSLCDSVNGTNLLQGYATQVRESKDGSINWVEIPGLFPEGSKGVGYASAINRMWELVNQTVRKGWITPLRTRSLSAMATESYQHRLKDPSASPGENNNRVPNLKVATAWRKISEDLRQLADFQDKEMGYHAAFQERNYRDHPDSWKVYTGTLTFIFASVLYSFMF